MLALASASASVASCGFSVDCPANYSLEDVNRSATQWDPTDSVWQRDTRPPRASFSAAGVVLVSHGEKDWAPAGTARS